jgi:hypothetical protein
LEVVFSSALDVDGLLSGGCGCNCGGGHSRRGIIQGNWWRFNSLVKLHQKA